jgi:hypothetical protein
MKQLIMNVLEDMSTGQINLESEASRELITNTIMAAIKTNNGRKGWVLDLSTYNGRPKLDTPIYEKSDEQKARDSWVCDICGENTFEVDYDYIGSGTNHLGCELKSQEEIDEYIEDIDEQAYAQGRGSSKDVRREKTWSQKKHEDKVFGNVQKQIYSEMTSDGLPEGGDTQAVLDSRKLAEEIVDNKEEKYIFESPDGGKTVFKRKFGSDKRELVEDWKTISE